MHDTSHAHELLHVTALHDCDPVHITLHLPLPHVTSWHDCCPEHVTLHDVVPVHDTPLRHELLVSHSTVHANPVGQVTLLLHAPLLALQSIVQLCEPRLHDVHWLGHWFASPRGASMLFDASIEPGMMQNPWTHCRPSLQSDCFEHA